MATKRITSEKAFIEKIKEGYKLWRCKQFKRFLFILTDKKEEIIVALGLIKKLEKKGIIDSNLDIHLNLKDI